MVLFLSIALAVVSAASASGNFQAQHSAANSSLLWGTYRPQVYFGTRTRTADAVLTGLMWHDVHEYQNYQSFRHTCEQGDELSSYAWLQHDGRSFGSQTINDGKFNVAIKTEFVKVPGGTHGGDWSVRISGTPIDESKSVALAVYFYVALTDDGKLEVVNADRGTAALESVHLNGHVKSLGDFSLFIEDDENNDIPDFAKAETRTNLGDPSKTHFSAWKVKAEDSWRVKDVTLQQLLKDTQAVIEQHKSQPPTPVHGWLFKDHDSIEGNVVVFQKMLKAPFSFDVVLASKSAHPESQELSSKDGLTGEALTKSIKKSSKSFSDRFEKTFHLREKGYNDKQIQFGEMLLSNMVGGIGYFHGTNIVDRSLEDWEETEPVDFLNQDSGKEESDDYFNDGDEAVAFKKPQPDPKREGPSSLFTAVPSRPFFPRGFLWDEGFHQLLIGAWDNDLSLEVIQSWSSKIDERGWVAREQILGPEAESKVPAEFQIQYAHFANPPTLLMSLLTFIERFKSNKHAVPTSGTTTTSKTSQDFSILSRMHLDNPEFAKEYLRTVYPQFRKQYFWFRKTQWGDVENFGRDGKSPEAYRWRGRSDYHTLTSGLDDYPRTYPPDASEIHVDLMSWIGSMAKALKAIAEELSIEKDIVKYEKHIKNIQQGLEDFHWNDKAKAYCDAVGMDGESTQTVHLGYINLFPFILNIVPEDSPRVKDFLDLISDDTKLWTPYGLASLSKSDKYFATGENYWRGPIWMNIQYLVLRRLHHYKSRPGPYSKKAGEIYSVLRNNIVNNVFEEYERTGYTWEQYSPIDGKGQRSHPFTGWTSLVLLMMAEVY
ncbi:putative mannosyl-oligosaccharide glucosidase [Chytriomyces sp. MP71]|nr:putative mannosyl-oligosaccharide glucosidase [Chytriomyces sp. MP71]